MQWAVIFAAFVAAAPSEAPTEPFERKVEVGGATYRVAVKRSIVTVSKKSVFVGFSIEERDKMRQAVKLATGCNVVDEIPSGAKLKGKLLCNEP